MIHVAQTSWPLLSGRSGTMASLPNPVFSRPPAAPPERPKAPETDSARPPTSHVRGPVAGELPTSETSFSRPSQSRPRNPVLGRRRWRNLSRAARRGSCYVFLACTYVVVVVSSSIICSALHPFCFLFFIPFFPLSDLRHRGTRSLLGSRLRVLVAAAGPFLFRRAPQLLCALFFHILYFFSSSPSLLPPHRWPNSSNRPHRYDTFVEQPTQSTNNKSTPPPGPAC